MSELKQLRNNVICGIVGLFFGMGFLGLFGIGLISLVVGLIVTTVATGGTGLFLMEDNDTKLLGG